MSKYSNLNTRICLDQYDISGFLNASDLDIKQEVPEVTCFSDAGPRRAVGNYDHSSKHGGFIDTADNSFDENMFAHLGSAADHYLLQLFGANAEASIAYESIVRLDGQPRKTAIGQGILLDNSFAGSQSVSRGAVLRSATVSGNGNGTGQNLGATTATQTVQVVYRVISGTFTSFTLDIQESQNDGGADPYASLGVGTPLSQAVPAAGVWRLTYTGATEAWKRVTVSAWNGTSALIIVTFGVVQP